MAPPRRCQGIKCPRTGAGARVRSALERGRPRSRGGAGPRARRSLLEVSVPPQTGRSPPEGGAHTRARRSLLEGIFEWAALVGRWGLRGMGRWGCMGLRGMGRVRGIE
jgi:hypothetical protein